MKNEKIFIGNIYQITGKTRIPGTITGTMNPLLELLLTERERLEITPFKLALLKELGNSYQDLETRKKYSRYKENIGDTFINEDEFIPINEILLPEEKGKNLSKRKKLYIIEGKEWFKGTILFPDDLDVISLS